VKYDSSGTAQWARSVVVGPAASSFNSVAVDSAGNVYAAGSQTDTGTFDYGNGVTAAGTSSVGNILLVKYDSSGMAQWAKSVSGPTGSLYSSLFYSVTIGGSDSVYAAGYQPGTGTCDYGNGVTAAGTSSAGNILLVKYDSSGTAQWARSVSGATGSSEFRSVATDSADNVYAAGYQYGTGTFDYGNGVTVAGSFSNKNIVLVKYSPSGTAQWARSVLSAPESSDCYSVAIDGTDNVYAAVSQLNSTGTETYTYNYGNGVVAGTYSGSSSNAVLVKYSSSGTAQWARSVLTGTSSRFLSVATSGVGNVYAAGYQRGTETYNYGNGITVTGTSSNDNIVLVKYSE
jgi:hypothetical protein